MRRGLLALFVLLIGSAASIASKGALSVQSSGATGSWSKAASLITGREAHTATLLRDGNVLIAGGADVHGAALASAEVYNPKTNRWASAGSMGAARLDHTATLLSTGKVLVVGGQVGPMPFTSLASAELYDPTRNSWSAAAPMIVSRASQSAVLLRDGRVLVVGGITLAVREGGLFPSRATDAEIYDATANRWSTTAPMGNNRLGQTATLLADGRVLVAGGQDGVTTFRSTEIYNPTEDRWISAGPMGVGRWGHAAALLPNGDVFVVGGTGEESNPPSIALSAEIYDPSTNLWVTVANMDGMHFEPTATVLRDGRVLVVGATIQTRPELFDLARNLWSGTGLSMDRRRHTATLLADGKVLIAGGYGTFDDALLYDPSAAGPALREPVDRRVVAALLAIALLLVAGTALSIPAVRQRLRSWRPRGEPEEWIT
jgi:trimeric autotransporter adhesin